ncbi:hypothetical protein F4778DRAFT_745624 [Xylariomycetidae sp. FL2044]|nr:hypothetical protein F4778DRAFT_745624 [Xylariomycetidae sp. FL2044]
MANSRVKDCYFTTDPRANPALARRLAGKNILIAGAGRGLGRRMAEFFAHCAPKSLSLCALELDEVEAVAAWCRAISNSSPGETTGTRTQTAALDVRDAGAVRRFVDEVVGAFGRVDVLVMNAGRPPQWLPLSQGEPDLWWHNVEIGIRGAYNFTRYVLPVMQQPRDGEGKSGGVVILTASAGAHANAGFNAYTVAKLAMVRLGYIIHAENFQKYNIKAFAMAPGAVPTRMFTDFKDKSEGKAAPGSYVVDGAEGEDDSVANALAFFSETQWDSPEMAAGMVVVLAGGELDFMSGRYVDSAVKVEHYVQLKESIRREDLYRVRLNAGEEGMIPRLEY